MTHPLLATFRSFIVLSFLPPATLLAITSALTDIQGRKCSLSIGALTVFPHGTDFITLVTSRVCCRSIQSRYFPIKVLVVYKVSIRVAIATASSNDITINNIVGYHIGSVRSP